MATQEVRLRVNGETARQIEELTSWLGATKSQVLTYAVEQLYQREASGREARPIIQLGDRWHHLADFPPDTDPAMEALDELRREREAHFEEEWLG